MAALGTLLGTGSSSGGATTATITCTVSQDPNERIHLFWLTDHFGTPIAQSQVSAAADSRSGTWKTSTTTLEGAALVGQTNETDASTDTYLIGSFIRTAGAALQAGDTITLTFTNTVSHPAPTWSAMIAQGFFGISDTAVRQNWGTYGAPVNISGGSTFISYSNGDSTTTNPPNQLLWQVDYTGLNQNPAPAKNCAWVALFGSLNGSAFVPFQLGSIAAETTSGPMYLVVVFDPLVRASSVGLEPGGSFTGASTTVGNYQFVEFASEGLYARVP